MNERIFFNIYVSYFKQYNNYKSCYIFPFMRKQAEIETNYFQLKKKRFIIRYFAGFQLK